MALLDLLVPPACASCGGFGATLCAQCVARFRPPSRDEDRFVAADAGAVIGERLELALAAFEYADPLRGALQRLKYAGASRVAESLAAAALPRFALLLAIGGRAPLVPVPLHPDRRRERGYNQALLLARSLATAHDLPVREALVRERSTTKQHRLDRTARLRNLVGAFRIAKGERVPPVAILVDDILTTSATLEACASVLRDAGATRVYGFTIAREV